MSESVIDFAALEAPTLEGPVETPSEESAPVEETQVQDDGQGGGAPTEPPAGKPTAPPTLKAVRDAVKAFEQTNPELGKHLKSLLDNEGRIRAYQEVYPDVESARSMRAAIEAAGGVEGLTRLTELQDHVDNVNAQWDSGDPAALDSVFENGGEGAVKLLPHYLNRVEKANPEAFGSSLRPHLVRSLQAANFEGALAGLARAVADKPEAKEIVDSIIGWFGEQKRLGEKTNLDALAPERQKLQERDSALSQREYKQFESEVNQEVKPEINRAFASRMRAYLQNDPRPQAAKQDIARAWLAELGKALEKDQKQIAGMMKSKSRNKQAIANFAKTRISAVADGVTKKIVDQYKLTPGKPVPRGGGGKDADAPATGVGSVSSPIKVKDKPADSNIDWDADPDRMHFISGKAKLLTGSKQWVKWR